jgi:hypothetical protein
MTSRPQTAISAALIRAGVNVAKTQLYQLALDTLRKNRATSDRGFSVFERIVEDDPDLVREAVLFYFDRVQSDLAGGHHPQDDRKGIAAPPANVSRPQEHAHHMLTARPVREPSAQDRAAGARVALTVAVTVFDSFKVRDGRGIGDVRFGELRRMMNTNAREAAVIRQILEHGDAPHDAQVRDIIKTDHLQRMIQRAAEIVDAAR